jgi:protein ImuA
MIPALAALRARIKQMESSHTRPVAVLPFGIAPLDHCLPGGGLALGALHEVIGGGVDLSHAAAASLFAAGIAARIPGPVLWCLTRADLFAPGLAQAGLAADRVIHLEAAPEASLLACCEETLRHGGVSVVAELTRLSMTASRRLQLAAERAGRPMIALRRARRPADGTDFGGASAAATRWRVSNLPSAPLPVPGIGRARWRVELVRCRAGESADFVVEACDAQGYLALPAVLADRSAAPADGVFRAAG